MDLLDSFLWNEYLEKTGDKPAAWECFKQNRTPPKNHFQLDFLLEAVDQRIALNETPPPITSSGSLNNDSVHPTEVAASSTPPASTPLSRRRFSATNGAQQPRRFRSAPFSLARVVEMAGPRLRVRLVGTDDRNDCWFLVDSDQIRPYPTHDTLQPPFGYVHNHLVWNKTLRKTVEDGTAAPKECFAIPPQDPTHNLFKKGDKLEAVDHHNAQLICPATIGEVSGLHVLISFDGWSGKYDYWTRFDSRDLFPCGWCKLAGHPLQYPGPAAIQHLNLTPTKSDPLVKPMPPPPPLPTPAVNSSALTRKAPLFRRRRRRITFSGTTPRRMRPLTSNLRRSLDTILTIKKEVITPTPTPPPPPLPRLTVITKTLEDGSPQTIIKATPSVVEKPIPRGTTEQANCSVSTPVEGAAFPSSSSSAPRVYEVVNGSRIDDENRERKRKKSKKHKRMDSREGGGHGHKTSGPEIHQSDSLNEYYQPTKLVIRHRSCDLTGSSKKPLFVDTMEQSSTPSPQLYVAFRRHLDGFSAASGNPSSVLTPQPNAPSSAGGNCDQLFLGQSRMPSSSTASPASMDLGPCPLPNPKSWSVEDVSNYLLSKDSSLLEVATTFRQQEIDGSAFLLLDMNTLRSLLKLKLGPALKIDNMISCLKKGQI